MLSGRRIVLGVSGGVAAYKAVHLARRLVEAGAEVKVIMTEAARQFVGPQSFAAVTGHPVAIDLFGTSLVSPHTELARWAELMVVAPATASLLARLAQGNSDDLLAATLLAHDRPCLLAPAMHTEMWEHPATARNVQLLVGDGHHLVGPQPGPLAGGDVGMGRMVEPEELLASIEAILSGPLTGRKVLVTAGGTREPIDPVRFLGNRSSGKMGHALAAEAARRGAEVTLVTSSDRPVPPRVEPVWVETAEEMAREVWNRAEQVDVVVMAAAVADFRAKDPDTTKLARGDGPPDLILEPTPDILAGLAERSPRPFLVGFAAETGSLDRAREKAMAKGVDLLVANDVSKPGSGFGTDSNEVTIFHPDGSAEAWPLASKVEVARRLWDLVAEAVQGG